MEAIPESHQSVMDAPHSIDQILSKELLGLSLKDRNAIEEEIHGISVPASEESPEFLEQVLTDLSNELAAIPDDKACKKAYLESLLFEETYVTSQNFRLRFLRCELFDAKKAALRLVNFLALASELYGPEVLRRPIQLKDLSPEAMKLMREGFYQVLPYRDRSGRPIYVWIYEGQEYNAHIPIACQICLYLFWVMSESVESQRKGFIEVVWTGPFMSTANYPGHADLALRMVGAWPIRLSGVHFCCPDKFLFHLIRALFVVFLGSDKFKVRCHVGEDVEVLYALKTYGIPVEFIPVTSTGNVKTINFRHWMKGRKLLENRGANGKSKEEPTMVMDPESIDVVFQRGQTLACHPGNAVYLEMIEERMREHAEATQTEKRAITQSIIALVESRGGRFLLWNPKGLWIELTDNAQIHTKVANQIKLLAIRLAKTRPITSIRSGTSVFQNQDHAKRRKLGISNEYSSDSDQSFGDCAACWQFDTENDSPNDEANWANLERKMLRS